LNNREKITSRVRLNPGRIRQNLHLVMLSAYLAILLANYARYGSLFQFSLGLYCLLALPVVYVLGNSREFVRNWVPFIILLLSYEALQGIVGAISQSGAIVSLFPLDKMLWGFNLTGTIQSDLNSSALTAFTTIMYSLHFPLITGLSIFLWYSDRFAYKKYVLALVVTSYLSLMIFVLLPTAPPWYSGQAKDLLGDVSGQFSTIFAGIAQVTRIVESNRFAAFPSLHAAYAVLFCYYLVGSRTKLSLLAIPITASILFSTIYLGQHYLIDLIAGAMVALSVSIAIELASRHKGRHQTGGFGPSGPINTDGKA
jgi:membrane-associated phospholipid phosphatase